MQSQALEGGFQQPAIDAAHAFRAIMEAMARPGKINKVTGAVPPQPLSVAAGACVLTLCDHETPIYLVGEHDNAMVREWISFHTGSPLVNAEACLFALGTWDVMLPLNRFSVGTAEYPDRSATLIVELDELSNEGSILSGPGIESTVKLSLPISDVLKHNHRQYPLGLDFLFTESSRIAALPRSTEVR